MEWLKNTYKLFNIVFPFADFVYLLQLEEYDTGRYWRWLPRFFLRRDLQVRQRLVHTPRAIITIFVSAVLFIISCALLSLLFTVGYTWFGWLIAIACIPLWVGAANALLQPLFVLVHTRMRAKALNLLTERRSAMRVVMVAGSYGKTTTKGFIEAFAKHQYRVQVPPGNTNTSSGIASWILKNLNESTNVLIIEADGYNRDEYLQTCDMIHADIAVLTNIGDQHLERFGSREALREALTEVFLLAQPNAHLVTTASVAEELQSAIGPNQTLHAIFPAQALKYRATAIEAPHLSPSQREDLSLALSVAEVLDIPERFVADAVRELVVPERRQRHGQLFGYEAIDDSYNISVSTASASVAMARDIANREGKKLLVVTAGIPELGPEVLDGNKQLGALLASNASHTVILGSIFARDIAAGFGQAAKGHGVAEDIGYQDRFQISDVSQPLVPSNSYTILPTLTHFQTLANTNWPPHEWLLLLLPELNDLYY